MSTQVFKQCFIIIYSIISPKNIYILKERILFWFYNFDFPTKTDSLVKVYSKQYFKMKNKQYDHLFKFVMVGNSAVGKSSLLLRFADDQFNQNYMITIGVDFRFKSLNINNKIVKMQIWDTAGQERFRTIVNTYYKNSNAVFMVFDLTNKETFKDIRNYWINEVENYVDPSAVLVLVGNKCDCEREVTSQEVEQFKNEKSLLYFETSAKTAENVKEMFIQAASTLIQKRVTNKGGNNKIAKLEHLAEEESGWKKCQC